MICTLIKHKFYIPLWMFYDFFIDQIRKYTRLQWRTFCKRKRWSIKMVANTKNGEKWIITLCCVGSSDIFVHFCSWYHVIYDNFTDYDPINNLKKIFLIFLSYFFSCNDKIVFFFEKYTFFFNYLYYVICFIHWKL